MQIPAVLVTLAFAGSAAAVAHPNLAAPTPTRGPSPLVRREDMDLVSQCTRAMASVTGAPSPNNALASWWVENVDIGGITSALSSLKTIGNVDGACSALVTTPTPPSSLSSAFSSYTSAYDSWHESVAPTLSSIAAKCTGDGLAGMVGLGMELVLVTDDAECKDFINRYNKLVTSSASTATPRYAAAIAGAAGLVAAFAMF